MGDRPSTDSRFLGYGLGMTLRHSLRGERGRLARHFPGGVRRGRNLLVSFKSVAMDCLSVTASPVPAMAILLKGISIGLKAGG